MPAVREMREATGGAIPIQTLKEIPAPVIHVPEFGAVTLDIEDDDDWLWLI
jgi:hypothetical protein